MVILNEENSELRGKKFPIFPGLKKHLQKTLDNYKSDKGDKTNPGYDHLEWLCNQESITTEEMKRIKNFFDNYKGTEKSDDFILYGGVPMKDWVNRMLENAKKVIKDQKQAMKDAGFDNAFRKSKDRDKQNSVDKAGVAKIQTKDFSNSLKAGTHVRESRNFVLNEEQIEFLRNL